MVGSPPLLRFPDLFLRVTSAPRLTPTNFCTYADRLVDRALVAVNPADAPGPAQDPDSDSDDDSIDVEGCMNGLTIGERVRLTHRIADRTNMPKIQRLTEKVGRKQLSIMNRPRDLCTEFGRSDVSY